jgi:putative transposase
LSNHKKRSKGENRFYVQLILEGYTHHKYELGNGNVGLDVGPSTIAMVGESKAELKEFCEEVILIDKEKRRINRKMDRQRRANNPNNYQSNGVLKKGRKKWVNSNRYIKTHSEHRELDRKIKEVRKQLHGRDTNQILKLASSIQTEKLSYKAFQKMFGKSIARKAPSMFLKMLKLKVESQGGRFREFPTYSTKLSQTCHCGEIKKKRLKDRWHSCACGVHAQHDLYSAFLARYVTKSNHVDFQKAENDWIQLSNVLDECISNLKNRKSERKFISTFGL